jgi:DNA-binding MarR family transcriptional regulator
VAHQDLKGDPIMEEKTSLELIQDLFKLVKRFPLVKFKSSITRDLSRSEYELLAILRMNLNAETPAISVSKISNLLQITPAGVTHMINPLEEKGFVQRLADPSDRRVVRIGLTALGTETADAMLTTIQEQLVGLMNHLGETDGEAFMRLLSRAVEYLSAQLGS